MKDLRYLQEFEDLLEDADNALVRQAQQEGQYAIGYTCYHMPEVLLNGHHANIAAWRREKSLEITRRNRRLNTTRDRHPAVPCPLFDNDVFLAQLLPHFPHKRIVQVAGRADQLSGVCNADPDRVRFSLKHIKDAAEMLHLRTVY